LYYIYYYFIILLFSLLFFIIWFKFLLTHNILWKIRRCLTPGRGGGISGKNDLHSKICLCTTFRLILYNDVNTCNDVSAVTTVICKVCLKLFLLFIEYDIGLHRWKLLLIVNYTINGYIPLVDCTDKWRDSWCIANRWHSLFNSLIQLVLAHSMQTTANSYILYTTFKWDFSVVFAC